MNLLVRATRSSSLASSASRLVSRYSSPAIPTPPNKHLFLPYPTATATSLIPRRSSSSSSSSSSSYFPGGRRPDVQHFRRRGPRWRQNPRVVLLVVAAGGAAAIAVYYANLEPVPYSNRRHFVIVPPGVERQLGESQFEQLKTSLRGRILPPLHPDTVRVRLVCAEIVGAVQRGLRHNGRRWGDSKYTADVGSGEPSDADDKIGRAREAKGRGEWSREDEVLDDRWIREGRKKKGRRPATKHLEGLNWEVIVVQDKTVNAMCLPGGKIVVFTGLLHHFRTDSEIATVIGHEVAHAIARHGAEGITKNLGFTFLQLVLLQFIWMPDLINTMSQLLLKLPFSRRMEMEADYIGLLLLAAAGYDPRVAPKVYEKLGQITGDSELGDYLSTHPSSKKRSQQLSQAQVMEEATQIYRESIAGHGVEGFL